MHKKKKVKKRLIIRNINKLFIGIIILLYFLSRMPPFFSQATNKTYIAEYGKIETAITTEGYIVRDEKVITSTSEGDVILLVNEGERVARGQKIATIHFNDLDDNITKDLEIINLRIENIKDKQLEEHLFQTDIQKINNEIETVTQQIQDLIKNGDYIKVGALKETLLILVEKKSIISGEKSLPGRNLEQLERQQQNLQEKVSASVKTIISEYPGAVALGRDGLEDLLTLSNLDYMTLQQFETIRNSLDNDKQQDDETNIRIIKNHQWSIITKLMQEDILGLEKERKIKIRQQGDNKEYNAIVRNVIQEDDDNCIVVLDLTEFMEEFYNKRSITFDVIIRSYEGVMIPNSAITEHEEQTGVFRLDVNGFARFVPIKAKGSNREYSIVYNGSFDEKVNNETQRINTINYYDEIVVDAEKINIGERIR
ncbi:putative membrane fusion protein [Natronincola peptidivorans]|uniref:Putative membrane fusion protein n=1 Tax=Natronincola peptidivorans TaxID=426128 RepID=A0A1H9Y9C3_9FIRM|nr:putative membrane fusion protein [Natronincola peptidivorans]